MSFELEAPSTRQVIKQWPDLPEAVKAGIVAMIRAASSRRTYQSGPTSTILRGALNDPDLQAVIDAWPRLPEDVRQAILSLVRQQGE